MYLKPYLYPLNVWHVLPHLDDRLDDVCSVADVSAFGQDVVGGLGVKLDGVVRVDCLDRDLESML